MLWAARLSGFFSAAMLMVVLSPSLQSFPPAEAIRSSQFDSHVRFPGQIAGGARGLPFRRAPSFRIERWMEIQKSAPGRIYELGSLPPFLLVFAGHVAAIEHRWNQHGLGGDNILGSCRDLHPGPVSLLHWSGSGKPWARLGGGRPCPLDALWAPFDLYGPAAVEPSR
ncbi:unnamed protein product [Triticum turgidum subsp. durum]|uniref:Hexosyltransferase n=1 Tax=Triticum turgidum subsp. durum TaxID=4567 RepID=A0A9R0VWD4_TRITD|nr:unnamed protein product [Triticum turgidum subsp. durum]